MSGIAFPEVELAAIKTYRLGDFVKEAQKALKEQKNVFSMDVGQGKKIGQIFAQAVAESALLSQIETIEKRYEISLGKIEQEDTGLKVEHVLAFALGILNPTQATMNEIYGGHDKDLSIQQQTKILAAKYHYASGSAQRQEVSSLVEKMDLSNYSTLIDPRTLCSLMVDKLSQELVKQTFDIDQLQEVLTKHFGTSALEEGMNIPLPALIHPETGQIVANTGYYQVYKKVSKEGLMAFALKPLAAPGFIKPMILFRPTALSSGEQDHLKTIAEDMEDHIGKTSFDLAKQNLQNILKDPVFIKKGEKAWVSGFSLAGAYAARLLAFSPDSFSKAFFFNDPSTEEQLALEFANKLIVSSHTKENPLDIRIFHNELDDVTFVGSYHVGGIPKTFHYKEKAESLCRIHYVKIKTKHVNLLTRSIIALAQVSINFRNFLAFIGDKKAALEFTKVKQDIHLQVVLSSFNQGSLVEKGKQSPRSASVQEHKVVDKLYLDKSQCPFTVRFNQKWYSANMKRIRRIIRFFCLKIAEIKNKMASFKTTVRRFIEKFFSRESRLYVSFFDKKYECFKRQIGLNSFEAFLVNSQG